MPMSTLKRLVKRGLKPGRKFTRGDDYQKPITSKTQEARRQQEAEYPAKAKKANRERQAQLKIGEALQGAKKAKRGIQPEKVTGKYLTGTPRKSTLDKMDASAIAQKYTGRQISAMQRKFKDPKILAKLKQARVYRKDLAATATADPTRGGPGVERRESMAAEFRKSGGKVAKRSGGGKISKPQGWGAARLPPKKT